MRLLIIFSWMQDHKPRSIATQVLATDGLWEVMSNAEVVAFVEDYRLASHEAMSAADALSWKAQQRWKAGAEQVRRKLGKPSATSASVETFKRMTCGYSIDRQSRACCCVLTCRLCCIKQ